MDIFGLEHYYFERTHPRWSWLKAEPLTREAVWKEWWGNEWGDWV
jgi:hypothetical protein